MKLLKKLFVFVVPVAVFFGFVGACPVLAVTSGPIEPYSFSASSGTQPGSVKLIWYDDGSAPKYNLLYGTDPNNYIYGVVDIAHSVHQANEFTVGYLAPGKTYYFKLCGVRPDGDTESGPIKAQAATNANPTAKAVYYSTSKNYEMPYLFALGYGKDAGTVTVTWFDNDSANKYDIVYGLSPGNYIYGFQDMPYSPNLSNTFSVGSLTPGTTYYFALVAERDSTVVSWSSPLQITAR